ncbi:MAG: sigma-70 family RNA polymerase sigma factor [Candidatus Doudnabacteria bacterium]|nr:sigma-70 family RNA polymerase sigma factor [Candidatus Doudnabacteria bacterium]
MSNDGKLLPLKEAQRILVEETVPFVEATGRRVVKSFPNFVELDDLIQDGIVGLIDAALRFDKTRGVQFRTFAERRIRGNMIDALRESSWPRGIRKLRRKIEEARVSLREAGIEPSHAGLAAQLHMQESILTSNIVRIRTLEVLSPSATAEELDGFVLPDGLLPNEPTSPEQLVMEKERVAQIRAAILSLPPKERKIIVRYYYGDRTMKQIGKGVGVNESRVSQLHARAIRRLREALTNFALPNGRRALRNFRPISSEIPQVTELSRKTEKVSEVREQLSQGEPQRLPREKKRVPRSKAQPNRKRRKRARTISKRDFSRYALMGAKMEIEIDTLKQLIHQLATWRP